MTPRRPYLLRAFYDWLLDNQLTPHLVVDVTRPDVQVPMEFARDGQIVLNIAPRAVGNLALGNEDVQFNARFGGVPRQVSVPMAAVLAIYARENGAGTMFEPEAAYDESEGVFEAWTMRRSFGNPDVGDRRRSPGYRGRQRPGRRAAAAAARWPPGAARGEVIPREQTKSTLWGAFCQQKRISLSRRQCRHRAAR